MKLIMILLTTAILQVSANSFAQRITLHETNTSLEKVIDKIRQQSGYDFVYNDFDLSSALNVTIHLNNVELEKSLKICLAGKDLDYEIKERTIIIKKKETTLVNALSQMILPAGPIKGSVIDANGIGLPGAVIKDKKTLKNIAVTNVNGDFLLNVEDGTILIVTFIGFKPQDLVIKKGMKNIIISLENDISKLDEVSVEGYRKGSQRLATSNISKISAEELEKQPVQNPLQALEGRIPGLVVTQTDGVPGARLNVQIRGRANFDKNLTSDQPLFIMDGVPIAAGNDRINLQTGPFGPAATNGLSAFAGINMADIESIDVLKDADATAIYGSRGANGVILITTKKGKAGKMVFNANVYSGISTVTTLTPLLNTQEYLAMRNEAFANDKIAKNNTNAYDLLVWDQNRYTDFAKLLVGNKARTNEAQVTISGGTKYNQYRLGGGYHKETTVWPGEKSSDRASVNFNLNSMSDNEKFTSNISGNYSIGNSTLTAVDLAAAVVLPPNYRLYDANGNIAWNEGNITDGNRDNPISLLNQQYLAQTSNLNANLTLNYKLFKTLVLRTSMGYNTTFNNERRITPITAQNPTKANLSGLLGLGNNTFKNWIIEPQAEYTGYVSKGKLNVLVGGTLNQKNTNSESSNASGATSDDLAGSLKAYTTFTAANTVTQYNYQAFFGRINYNWEDKYIVNLTGRRDASSRFGPNYRFSNFGAVGLAWIFTNEPLLKKNNVLSYGKIRFSSGVTGNDQIGDYTYLDTWAGTNTYNDSTTLAATKLYNPYLHWERNNKMELGLELGFFRDRVLLSASIYQNISTDPLVSYPLPRTTGFASIVENLDGVEIQNRGLELTLSTQNFNGSKFKWSTDFNLTVPRNILKKFPNLATSSYATTYAIGESMNRVFTGQYLGVDPTTGLYSAKDVDGDGKVTSTDYTTIGDTDPKFYGGVNNSFSYKRFSLSFFFQFTNQIGKDWRASGATLQPVGSPNNVPTLALDRWQNPGDVANVQRFTTSTGTLQGTSGYYAGYFSSLNYTDASFLRLKNLAASYSLPPKFLSSIHVNSFRVYLQAQNLFVITPYKGADPETQSYTLMPPLRTVTFGLQLTL